MSDPLQHIAKLLIVSGIIIAVLGALLLLFRNSGIPFLGKLPGDIIIQKKKFYFLFPCCNKYSVEYNTESDFLFSWPEMIISNKRISI